MSAPDPRPPAGRPSRDTADPLQMSLAEKLACEWEARHDVAARRRVVDAAPVQHYLASSRSEHHPEQHPEQRTGARATRARPAHQVPKGLAGWVRWGEDGSPGNPVIPRC